MITPIPKEIKIYSSFNSLRKYSSLYFLVRSADVEGSGKVTFDIRDLTAACDRTRPTIQSWIRDCCDAGYFRYVEYVTRHTVTIYYRNLDVFALAQGIGDLGVVTDVPLEVFKTSLHIWMTEVATMNLQDQSYFSMHEKEAKRQERKRPRVNTPADIFNAKPQEIHTSEFIHALSNDGVGSTGTSPVYLGDRCAFVGPTFTMFGGSQETIAKRAGLTPRTIRRHLGDDYRTQKGLEPIRKYQLAVAVGKGTTEQKQVKRAMDNHYDFVDRLFVVGRGESAIEFFAGTNVYQSKTNYRYSDRRATKIRNLSMKIVEIPTLESISITRYTKH
jgi:hypothetical protein